MLGTKAKRALTVDNHLEATIWTSDILVCVSVSANVSVCMCVMLCFHCPGNY